MVTFVATSILFSINLFHCFVIWFQVLHDVDNQTMEADEKLVEETDQDLQSLPVDNVDGDQAPLEEISIPSKSNADFTVRSIPPPGGGQRIYEIDPYLLNHREHLDYR